VAIALRTPGEIDAIAAAGLAAQRVLATLLDEAARPGATGLALDACARDLIAAERAEPLFPAVRDARGLPHGAAVAIFTEDLDRVTPTAEPLARYALVSIDVGLRLDGWCADLASPVALDPGAASTARAAVAVTRAMAAAAAPGERWGGVLGAGLVAAQTLKVVIAPGSVGHGLGRRLHEPPALSCPAPVDGGLVLVPGMVVCVEPVVRPIAHVELDDVRMPVPAAYHEVMVAVTDRGSVVLADAIKSRGA